jgi:hypothetical protein
VKGLRSDVLKHERAHEPAVQIDERAHEPVVQVEHLLGKIISTGSYQRNERNVQGMSVQ